MTTSRLLPSLWADFDRLFNEFTGPMGVAPLSWASAPLLHIREDADAFLIEADLPGLTQEQVHISVTQRNQVSISGERLAAEPENGRWHRRERGFGRFQRVVKLPTAVDADKVEAKLENGVLLVTLPKAEEAKPRRIAVKAV
jgi:HSP20 family protein